MHQSIPQLLWIVGSSIILILGTIHLVYTFFTGKFSSKDELTVEKMKTSKPNITRETTMWKAWIGFNASHSSGAIFIGTINVYTAIGLSEMVLGDPVFIFINLMTLLFYLWLAHQYWFRIPFYGILTTFICYSISAGLLLW